MSANTVVNIGIPDSQEVLTDDQVRAAVVPESERPAQVQLGGKCIQILPLKRRWQSIFAQAVLPYLKPELAATESIQKAILDGTADFTSMADIIISGELAMDLNLDRVVAVILASQVVGAEKDVEQTIANQIAWLLDNATTDEMHLLVQKQMDKERLIEKVGERLPARLARYLHLAGRNDVSADLVKQHLTSFWRKSAGQTGDGNSTSPKPGGSS